MTVSPSCCLTRSRLPQATGSLQKQVHIILKNGSKTVFWYVLHQIFLGLYNCYQTPSKKSLKGPNFEQKKYYAENETRRNRPPFIGIPLVSHNKNKRNSVQSYSAEQKIYRSFGTNHFKAFQSKNKCSVQSLDMLPNFTAQFFRIQTIYNQIS